MARGKKKGGKNRGGDSTDEDIAPSKKQGEEKQLSRKEKRLQKQQQKQQAAAASQKKHDSDDSDDDILALVGKKNDHGSDGSEDAAPKKKLTKKQRQAAARAAAAESSSEEEESSEDEMMPLPVKKSGNKRNQKKKQALIESDSGDDDDESEEEEIPQPVKKGGKNNKMAALAFDSSSSEEQDDNDDEESVEQIAFTIIEDDDDDDDGGGKKKKKKDKKKKDKEKKKKHHHKDKKKKDKKTKEDAAAVDEVADNLKESLTLAPSTSSSQDKAVEEKKDESPKVPFKPHKKSKFELQMEQAMKKKEEHDEEETKQKEIESMEAAEKSKKVAEKAAKQEEEEERMQKEADEIRKKMEAEATEETEVMYGAPDDKAWTDKSASQHAAEEEAKKGPDRSLTHGPDGKKLSNKERKRLQKAREAELRAAEYEVAAAKASREGAQFACSQTAINEKDPQWENSLDINVPNFSISAAGKILFKDAALMIGHGRRYGLVGPNGKGKSTLLKMIASRDLMVPPRIDFLYVEQEVVADETPAVEAVLRADEKRWNLMEEEKQLMEALDAGDEDTDKLDRLQHVTEELAAMGADASEAKARRILFGLGFDMEMQTKPTKMFSGGWRMRISLARALFVEPTLLMLDEPTNHLDLNAVIWLDDYLQRWKKTLLVVSHDQDFMNSVCQEILHIEDLKLISYKGNYDSFKQAEKTKIAQQQKAWEKQEKRLRELKKSGQSKAKAAESVKRNAKREPGARSKKAQNNAIASGTETATQQELIKRPKEYTVKLHFPEVAELSRPVMEVNRVHFRYSAKHPVIFDEIDFGIDMQSRVCVVGPNGAGKSTLLKLLTGELTATKGDVRRNPRLRMGIYNQHFVDRLPMTKTPVEHLRDRYQDEDYQSIRNRLGKYGLEGHAHEVIMRDLSGGQKARVVFVDLSLQQPHILLLDEPTNNLDVETIDALIDAMNEFNGGIVVVTHDQRLIEECDCTLWVVEKRGVTEWTAGFEDYKDTLLREMEEEVAKEAAKRQKKLEANAAAKAEKLARLASKLKS